MTDSATQYRNSRGLLISMPLKGILRITDGTHSQSHMVSAPPEPVRAAAEGGILRWEDISLDPETMALYLRGQLLCADHPVPRRSVSYLSPRETEFQIDRNHLPLEALAQSGGWPVMVCKTLGPEDAVYGLGDKPGFLNKRHYAYENWCTDDPSPHTEHFKRLYKAINFFILHTPRGCCGFLADNTFHSWFDFGKECRDRFWFAHSGGGLDYYMIPGPDLKTVVLKYQQLTGRVPLQQKWVYGFHQSHWGYFTKEEVLEVARTMRENQLPMDAVFLDIDHMDGCRNFTFDPLRFGEGSALTHELMQHGVKTVAIVNPGIKQEPGNELYDSGLSGDHYAKNPDGSVYVGKVWPGDSVFPDFTRARTRRWWGDQAAGLLEQGIRGLWLDMNEPANFTGPLPEDVRFSEGSHRQIHNVYGHLMARAAFEGLTRASCRRPFLLTRACCAGSQRYCFGWTGDNHSHWAHMQLALTQILNLGMSGMGISGADVGGYNCDCTEELLVRWMQFGALCPYFRNHYAKGTRFQEPYAFGPEAANLCREALNLRYHLLPYIYDLAHEELPMVRPLILEYPEDKNCRNLSDQFLLGPDLLAAPVFSPGITARAVYLPEGIWYDYYTGQAHEGGRYILAEAPANRIPLFARAGAILPVSVGNPQSVEEIREIRLEVFPGEGRHIHYTDDGETVAFRQGALHALELTLQGRTLTQKVLQAGYPGPDSLEVLFRA